MGSRSGEEKLRRASAGDATRRVSAGDASAMVQGASPSQLVTQRLAGVLNQSAMARSTAQHQRMLDGSPGVQALRRKVAGLASPKDDEKKETTQWKAGPVEREAAPAPPPNRIGLPDQIKAGVEGLSGMSLDDVRVHYNSDKPAQLQALAYTQGSDIHVAPGQQRHVPHEAWHVVQQRQGRVPATTQFKGVGLNDDPSLEAEADRMGARAAQMKGKPARPPPQRQAISASRVAQRIVGDYKSGTTLAYNTIAMRGLSPDQMKTVQRLHDESTQYSTEQARQIAGLSTSSNPYEWDVTGSGSYATTTAGMQDILDRFGHPTQPVVKLYDDLASRIGDDVGTDRKGALKPETISDLHQHFEASKPLHVGFNPFLKTAWEQNLADYTGAKTGIPLYSVMRSQVTKDFQAQLLGTTTDLNAVLRAVSGRPAEVHHLLFKALYRDYATTPANLMLAERSESEKTAGPGQHELMHKVASGNATDKFRALLPQYVEEYSKWWETQTGTKL